MYTAGGYTATSAAGVNIMTELKSHEGLNANIPFTIRTISFTPEADCSITINGGTEMFIAAGKTYSNDEVIIKEFKIIDDLIAYGLVYNY